MAAGLLGHRGLVMHLAEGVGVPGRGCVTTHRQLSTAGTVLGIPTRMALATHTDAENSEKI